MTSLAVDYRYVYPSASTIEAGRTSPNLALATCTDEETNPYFFEGRLVQPFLTARLLQDLSALVRTRFFLQIDPLFDPCTPMHAPQSFALVQSLVSGYVVYAPEVTAAIDLAIAAIQDGRYDAQRVGEYLAMHIESVQRWVKALQVISKTSRLHALQVAQSILAVFDYPLPKSLPARMADLYSLLYELLQELDMALPDHKKASFAVGAKGTSKMAKLAKQILDYAPETPFDSDAVLVLALEGRLVARRELAD